MFDIFSDRKQTDKPSNCRWFEALYDAYCDVIVLFVTVCEQYPFTSERAILSFTRAFIGWRPLF